MTVSFRYGFSANWIMLDNLRQFPNGIVPGEEECVNVKVMRLDLVVEMERDVETDTHRKSSVRRALSYYLSAAQRHFHKLPKHMSSEIWTV